MIQHRQTGMILALAAACLAVAVGAFFVLSGLAHYKTAVVTRRWERTLGTRDQILERYPAREANAAALTLERLSARLGISTAPRPAERRAMPTREQQREFSRFKVSDVAAYRNAQLGQPRRGLDPPPASAVAYLEAHEAELEAVRAHLTSAAVPYWERHLEKLQEAPIPNLLGHIDLAKLLVTDALAKEHAAEHETALRDLDATWNLSRALRDEPILIEQLIAHADVRMVAGALRQMSDVPAIWRDRLDEHDFRASFTTALKYEAWMWTQWTDAGALDGLGRVTKRVAGSVGRPYFQYCLADTSDDFRRRIENLDGVTALCDYDLSAQQADLAIPIPRWNVVAGLVAPNLGGALERLARLEVDLELTAKLLELDEARRANGDRWPAPWPGIEVSRACPQDRFSYEVAPNGEMTLALGRELHWPQAVVGVQLATAITVP